MTYTIGYIVKGCWFAEVEAESLEEAREIAERQFCDADFGELNDSEGEAYTVDDENGNREYLD